MGLAQAFNLAITPHVECKKIIKNKKVSTHTPTSIGTVINGSKEPNFNFDSNETSSEDNSILLHASLGRRESKPRFASCMTSIVKLTIQTVELCPLMKEFLNFLLANYVCNLCQPSRMIIPNLNLWNKNFQSLCMGF